MAKRIVSGIFILTALGALGVILAGAMTSGEQLIVRFLTAVTVAALALYVISDLRLQNEQEEAPTERDREHVDRSAARTATVESTVTTSRRRDRFARRGRGASVQPTPNFEAIEPVTARQRPAPLADPTEAVTGSRLVPPAPQEAERIVPPHPKVGHSPDERPDRPAPFATSPPLTPPISADVAPRVQTDAGSDHRLDDGADGVVESAVEEVTGNRVDAEEEFVTPTDQRQPSSSNGSVIATTSFTYSGRLHSLGVEWPPKPPETEDGVGPTEIGDSAAPATAIDAPTAELPALNGLAAFGTDEDPLLAMFSPDTPAWKHGDDQGAASDSRRDLFAMDTADLFVIEHDEPQASEMGEAADDADRPPSNDENSAIADSVTSAAGPDDPPTTGSQFDPAPARPLIRRIEAAQYAAPPRTDHLDLRDTEDPVPTGGPVTTGQANQPVPAAEPVITGQANQPFPAVGPSGSTSPDKLTAAIRSGEIQVINSLINQGMLSTSGPITDRDVRTMVYVAFTSNELRKLILAGGTPDGIRAGDLDLGEVELFDESRFAPPPKLLYSGPLEQSDAIIDLVALENESGSTGSSDSELEHDLDAIDDIDGIDGIDGIDDGLVPTLPTPTHLYRRTDADRVDY